ncbi:MAG: hypothetical protein GX683_04830 [Ruminococcaceae bacterium]|nr:hypothetical protein [Oscillospiraceae bacterium]
MAIGVLQYIIGYANVPIFLVLTFLKGLPLGITTVLMFMFTPDCAEYGRYTTGINATGITFAIQTFSVKLLYSFSAEINMAVSAK